jgi:hypothetical protein
MPSLYHRDFSSYQCKKTFLKMSQDVGTTESVPKTTTAEARKVSKPGKSWMKCRPIGIVGTGGQNVVSNDYFQTLVDTSDAWISKSILG